MPHSTLTRLPVRTARPARAGAPPGPGTDTIAVHAAREDLTALGVHVPPIDLSTTYPLPDIDAGGESYENLATGGTLGEGHSAVYQRLWNPTVARLERAVAALEGADEAVAFGSGMAALSASLLACVAAGTPHVVAIRPLYGGTDHVLATGLLGTRVTWAEADRVAEAIQPDTGLVVLETPANPTLDLVDIAAVVEQAGTVPVLVDNTFATPVLQRPLDHGATLVLHSATKFLGGHGTTIAGIVVDAGTFDFGAHGDRFPGFVEPDPSYHGLKYWEALGPGAYAAKLRVQLLRDTGAAISPFNSFLILQGIETLSLRMERHVANAQALAEWLESRDEVAKVYYPGLPSSPYYEAAKKYLPKGAGAIVSFELHGGIEAGRAFVDGTELFSQLVNIGDVRSLIVHPASTTHSQLTPEEQLASGVTPGLVRLSVGLEHVDDLRADLEAGLRAAKAYQ